MSDNQPTVRDAKPLFAFLLGLILFLFGIAIGYMVGGKGAAAPGGKGYDQGYAAAKADIQKQLADQGLVPPADVQQQLQNQPLMIVSGQITAIDGNAVHLTVSIPPADVLSQPQTLDIVANVTKDTKILLQKDKSPEQLQADLDAFQKAQDTAAQADQTAPQPPEPFTSTAMSLSDLKVGQTVTVSATDDIRSNTTFDAVQITYAEPVAPPAPADVPADINAAAPPAPAPEPPTAP